MAGKDIAATLAAVLGFERPPDGTSLCTLFEPSGCSANGLESAILVRRCGDEAKVFYLADDEPDADFWDAHGMGDLGRLEQFDSRAARDVHCRAEREAGRECLVVDCFKHGDEHFSVAGTTTHPHRFDVSPRAAYTPPEHIQADYRGLRDSEDQETAFAAFDDLVKRSNVILNDYSRYCNGEVFGACVETWAKEGAVATMVAEDCVWKLIGYDNAIDYLLETVVPEHTRNEAEPEASPSID